MRAIGCLISALCVLQQLGAVCTEGCQGGDVADTHTCRHHHTEQSPAKLPNEGPPRPLHLCSSSHAMFVAPVVVALPDPPAPRWCGTLSANPLADGHPSIPDSFRRLLTGSNPALAAPLRAELQIFQI